MKSEIKTFKKKINLTKNLFSKRTYFFDFKMFFFNLYHNLVDFLNFKYSQFFFNLELLRKKMNSKNTKFPIL